LYLKKNINDKRTNTQVQTKKGSSTKDTDNFANRFSSAQTAISLSLQQINDFEQTMIKQTMWRVLQPLQQYDRK
jgi:hypothetical protein